MALSKRGELIGSRTLLAAVEPDLEVVGQLLAHGQRLLLLQREHAQQQALG